MTQTSSSRLPVDTLPTQVLSPSPRQRPMTKVPSSAGSSTVGSPLEAIERDEILRTRRFCLIAVGIALAGGASTPLLPGDPTATLLILSAIGVALVGDRVPLQSHARSDRVPQADARASAGSSPPRASPPRSRTSACSRPRRSCSCSASTSPASARARASPLAVYATCAGMQAARRVLVISGARTTPASSSPTALATAIRS